MFPLEDHFKGAGEKVCENCVNFFVSIFKEPCYNCFRAIMKEADNARCGRSGGKHTKSI